MTTINDSLKELIDIVSHKDPTFAAAFERLLLDNPSLLNTYNDLATGSNGAKVLAIIDYNPQLRHQSYKESIKRPTVVDFLDQSARESDPSKMTVIVLDNAKFITTSMPKSKNFSVPMDQNLKSVSLEHLKSGRSADYKLHQ